MVEKGLNDNNKRICICNCYSSQGKFPLRHLLNVQTFYRFCHQRSKCLVPMCCHSFCFWIGSNELLVVFPWDTQESRTNMLEKLFSYPLLSFFAGVVTGHNLMENMSLSEIYDFSLKNPMETGRTRTVLVLFVTLFYNSDDVYYTYCVENCFYWVSILSDSIDEMVKFSYLCLSHIFRSPSSMAISWSYVHSDFWLLWKKKMSHPLF